MTDKKKSTDLSLYDKYMELNFRGIVSPPEPVNRRDFLKLFGAGIVVLISVPSLIQAQQSGGGSWGRQLPDDFNAFLRIGEDGRVTGFTGKIEMGQGANTSLTQTLADELDVEMEVVDLVMGDTDLCPWDMGTFGSMTTRFFGPPFRKAAAEAKAVLVELAAERLGVPKGQLITKNGAVIHRDSQKQVTYAELAQGKKIVRELKEEVAPESPDEFTIVGKAVRRIDSEEKVTGKAKFSSDVVLPEMLCAKILRPPSHGAVLESVDLSEARKMSGLTVVETEDLIAVLHKHPDIAQSALDLVKARFKPHKNGLNDKNIFDHLLKSVPAGETVAEGGTLSVGEDESQVLVDEDYLNSYVAHAPIEPHSAVARVEGGKATVWASTQTPFRLKDEAAAALGVSPENVRVLPPYVGGGYGGKSSNQQAIEAVKLAKETGKPVQVAWSREEEFFSDTFRPAAVVKIKAGASSSGDMTLWDYGVYAAGQRGSEQFYKVPHHRTVVYGSGWRGSSGTHPLATGAWRAPANNTNTFARECHIDLLASKVGMDPVEFRLKNLEDGKMKGVLEVAAEKFGWSSAKAPSGRGYGVSLGIDAGTYVAHMAEVDVDRNAGRIEVKRILCVQNMGLCVNPAGAVIQMEGCITMGLGYALAEEIRFEDGAILDKNFDTYKIPRFSWLPEIETVIIDARHEPPQGGGEPAIISMGAVIANAVFDATGARVLQLPMTPERVKSALGKV